ncbi:MAG: tetratricopeptide repeat protein [Acidobacteriia bacterium]|nr:tetratricopeptide repeat protein [Terriglobia bacterium]
MPVIKRIWIPAGLVAAVLALYWRVGSFGFVDYDDDLYLLRNPHLHDGVGWAFRTGYAANWHPLTWLSYLAGMQMYGLDPGWHHLTNVLLHAASAAIFFAAFYRMIKAAWPSAFVAFAFALHPLHVEAVAWVAERKEVLSGLFWALSLWTYAIYAGRRGVWRYLLVLAMFAAGLMSKSMIVTLPFVLLLVDVWPLKRRAVVEKIPMFAMAAAASMVTYLVQQSGGAVSTLAQVPFGPRLENALVSYVVYALKFFWPSNLAVIYPYDSDLPVWMVAASAAALIAITAFAVLQFRARPYLTIGWLWFLGTLVPVIGLVQIGVQSRADRYTYIPTIGLAIAVAWGGAELPRRIVAPAAAILCAAWAAVSWVQIGYWQDSVALFRHAVEATDGNWMAMAALGHTLIEQNRLDEAQPYLVETLRLRPTLPEAHINAGAALSKRDQFPAAEAEYRRAVALEPGNPDAREGLGVVLIEEQRYPEAESHLMEALRARPDDADTHYNLGRLYGLAGQPNRAVAEFREAVRLKPESAEDHYNLGTALAAAEQFDEAAAELRSAIALNPGYARAHFNLAGALATLGRYDEAMAEFREVLRIDPGSEQARQGIEECMRLKSERP